MTGTAETQPQKSIEERAAEFKSMGPVSSDITLEYLFGPADDWKLSMEQYQLILIPAIWQWWYYDRIHDRWEDTGYDAGEVVFSIRDGELLPPRKKRQNIPSLPASDDTPSPGTAICRRCGHIQTNEKKFCGMCGLKIQGR
jgi:hypothetical protein